MDEETLTVWLDTALLMLGGFILMTILMLAAMNPPKKEKDGQIVSPGTLIIEAEWPDDIDADVDLWVQAPGERPVGYSNKSSPLLNLLRDDLGKFADISNVNHEEVFARATIAGEYIVNVHLYRCDNGCTPPIKVHLVAHGRVGFRDDVTFAVADVSLLHENDQITAFRFQLNEFGELVPGSVNHVYKELRSKK